MAPKKKEEEPPPPPVPELQDEVEVPAEVGLVPEPSFCLVLGHLAGHTFMVEGPGEGEDPTPQEQEFDPCAALVERAKKVGDALAKRFAVVEREELQLGLEEGKSLATRLRDRLEKERTARMRAKSNAVRRKAIEAFTAAQQAAEEGAEVAEPLTKLEEDTPQADFCLLVRNYPATTQEAQELAAERYLAEGLVDLWAQVYLAGETLGGGESDLPAGECSVPEQVTMFYDAISSAPVGSDMADCTICTVRDSNELAFSYVPTPSDAEGGQVSTAGDRVHDAVLKVLNLEAESRLRYQKWIKEPARVAVPVQDVRSTGCEMRLYNRLMNSVDPSHHDIPLLLHCLTEQVGLDLDGEAQTLEDDVALSSLQDYLDTAHHGVLSAGSTTAPRSNPRPSSRPGTAAVLPIEEEGQPPEAASTNSSPEMLSHFDRYACAHHLAAGGGAAARLAGIRGATDTGGLVVDATSEAWQRLSVPGAKRSQLPEDSIHSAGHRESLQSRLYPFAPSLSSAALEQFVVLQACEDLLRKAEPERPWHLGDHVYRELIPKELLSQTLAAAFQTEPLVDSAYLPRYDCLLIVLHWRSLQGRAVWHAWHGDLLTPHDSARWADGLYPIPTYNDWASVCRGRLGEVPKPRVLLDGSDAREMGYSGIAEKLVTPADGSIILVTTQECGITQSFPMPSNEQPPMDEIPDAITIFDGAQSTIDAQSTIGPVDTPQPPSEAARFDAPPRQSKRFSRVMKDGLTFGIVGDTSWTTWQSDLQRKLQEQAEKVAAQSAPPEPEDPAEEEAPAHVLIPPISLPFEDTKLGSFWLALPSGARCTVRMHHERIAPTVDVATQLPQSGTLFTYTMVVGQVIQVFSDGSVRFSWPLQLRNAKNETLSGATAGDGADGKTEPTSAPQGRSQAANTNNGIFAPGCSEDVEISRTITPLGTLVRSLLSGRVEVFHVDGTTAVRNPTTEELEAQLQRLRSEPMEVGGHRLELLERLLRAKATDKGILTKAPTEKEKAAGLPGHWVVVRHDGVMFGRVATPPPPEPPVELPDAAEAGAEGGDAEPVEQTPPPSLQDLLGGELVEDRAVIQYDIAPVSTAHQVDLQTKHKTMTNALGLASFEDPVGIQKVSVHADGTQVMRTSREGGYDVSISKEPFALVKCAVNTSGEAVGAKLVVECSDGAVLETVPQKLVGASALQCLAPDEPEFAELSTHARVSLKTREGAAVVSPGLGSVHVLTGASAAAFVEHGVVAADCYVARCDADCLCLRDADGGEYELRGDQTLNMVSVAAASVTEDGVLRSPRCLISQQSAIARGMEDLPVSETSPPPRFFLVYGDGRAEELLSTEVAQQVLQAAADDPSSYVVGPTPYQQDDEHEAEEDSDGRVCHTVFQMRFPNAPVLPQHPSIALPDGLDVAGSIYSAAIGSTSQGGGSTSQVSNGGDVCQYRQLVQYPAIDEETRVKFQGTLKQYRQWEVEQIQKLKLSLQPEVKGKKDAKKDKKDKEKEKKKKKGKKGKQEEEEKVEEVVELPPEPKFIMDLNLTAFEHEVQALALRAKRLPEPSRETLLERGLALLEGAVKEKAGGDADAGTASRRVSVIPDPAQLLLDAEARYRQSMEGQTKASGVDVFAEEAAITTLVESVPAGAKVLEVESNGGFAVGDVIKIGNEQHVIGGFGSFHLESPLENSYLAGTTILRVQASRPASPDQFGMDETAPLPDGADMRIEETGPGSGPGAKQSKKSRPPVSEAPIFSFFQSEMGLQFLMDNGELDPESRPPPKTKSQTHRRREQPPPARGPWNPRLVGEPDPAEEEEVPRPASSQPAPLDIGRVEEDQYAEDAYDNAPGRYGDPRYGSGYPDASYDDGSGGYYQRGNATIDDGKHHPILAEHQEYPLGPHPDKRSANWDVTGEERPPKKPVSQAYVSINQDYLEIEGATDRRVRTASVAQKKNASKAPSVSHVRKTGTHAIGLTSELGAKDILGDAVQHVEEHWKLSSTMQGLGSSDQLVDVRPGACRFGPLRRGSLYRMAFFVRNLDVDVTRFNVAKMKSDYVSVEYQPGQLAPGMAAKIMVYVAAIAPAKIEQLVEVKLKAHVIRVPVTARVFDAEEYDRLDAESLALHGRRIGRHRERSENNKPGPVELVLDEVQCRKVLGPAYMPPPADFVDTSRNSPGDMLR